MQQYTELSCPSCSFVAQCSGEELLRRMQQLGMLRRVTKPDWSLVEQLLETASARFRCPRCDHAGLVASAADPDEALWETARLCETCGKPIATERLEVFPDALRCAACQGAAKQSASESEPEFCPKCGELMKVRPSRGAGITRYVTSCPKCRR